jgi:hypothetical protein
MHPLQRQIPRESLSMHIEERNTNRSQNLSAQLAEAQGFRKKLVRKKLTAVDEGLMTQANTWHHKRKGPQKQNDVGKACQVCPRRKDDPFYQKGDPTWIPYLHERGDMESWKDMISPRPRDSHVNVMSGHPK